jgi:hypothetical protein
LALTQNAINFLTIKNIDTLETITRALAGFSQGLKTTDAGQLVDVDDRVVSAGNDMTNDCLADRARAASV